MVAASVQKKNKLTNFKRCDSRGNLKLKKILMAKSFKIINDQIFSHTI